MAFNSISLQQDYIEMGLLLIQVVNHQSDYNIKDLNHEIQRSCALYVVFLYSEA